MTYAHAKGALGVEQDKGFILVHSCPNFTNIQNSKIQLSISSDDFTYGQHFFCISASAQVIDQYAYQLLIDYPYIYVESFVPANLASQLPFLKKLSERDYKNRVLVNWQMYKFQSLAGQYFYKFSKSRDYVVPFYDSIISPQLKVDFIVETWGNGQGGLLSPNCTGSYKTISNLAVQISSTISYQQTTDHSKYGAALTGGYYLCLGDINRMESQFDRGGGTVCLESSTLNSIFLKLLAQRQVCSTKMLTDK